MNKFEEKTLASALASKGLSELPQEWDKKTPFNECIVKITTKAGDGYFIGKYEPSDKLRYKVVTAFESVSYSRSANDVIYPLGVVKNKAKATPIVTAPNEINFTNEEDALEWLKAKKYRGWQLLKTPEAIKAAVEKVLTAEMQTVAAEGEQPKEEITINPESDGE